VNAKNALLGAFVVLTVVLASIAGIQYIFPRIQTRTSTSTTTTTATTTATVTSFTNTTSTSTTCTYTGFQVVACPSHFNQTFTVSVSYGGPWGMSYQAYVDSGGSVPLTPPDETSSFYGHGPANQSVSVVLVGTSFTFCVEAQKLDPSSSTLVLRILLPSAMNQTSTAYGTTKICLAYVNA
jgi:hypothetical protein